MEDLIFLFNEFTTETDLQILKEKLSSQELCVVVIGDEILYKVNWFTPWQLSI
jgi:hypothetical protein